nr:putative ribonuclease H-like domain-containing protein [Tanacetum cinerariifolium]
CKKQTVVSTSSTEAEYVAAASGCAQVLSIQNQLLDYGANDNCDSPLIGVNTPRSDEDRLKLMELMVLLLQKGVCVHIGITAARLSSYCCQANVSAVWLLCDVTRLQALVDKKKIVISEAAIREILQLNDTEGVVRLPNEEIFASLAQMGYEKPSTKLPFYKAFFSSQWKFLIHTILQSLRPKGLPGMNLAQQWLLHSKFYMYPRFTQLIIQNQVGDLSTHTIRFISPDLTQKVFANMRRVGKVDAAVEENVPEDVAHDAIPSPPPHAIPYPLQEPSSPPQQQQSSPQTPPQDAEFPTQLQQVLNVCSTLSKRVENLENDNAAQKLEIVKLKERVKKLEKANKIKSSKLRRLRKVGTSRRVESSADMEDVFNQGRMIDDMDMDEGNELAEIYNLDLDHSSKVLSMQEDDSEVQEVIEVVTTAKLITEVVTVASSQVSAASTTIPAASATIPAAKPTIPGAAPTVVAAHTRRRKGVIIRDPKEELPLKTPAETPKVKDKGKRILVEIPKPVKKKDQIEMDAEYARKLQEEIDKDHDGFNKDIDWTAAMDHVNQKSNNPQYIKRYQGMKRRPQMESEARKNMMIYLKNTAGYKMDFFKE